MDAEKEFLGQLDRLSLEVDPSRCRDLIWLLDELLRWNRRINLTAVRGVAEGIEKHLVDSLTLLPLLSGEENLLDLGSGGGFPGLPLKIASPSLAVTSVDAVGKKIAFQRHVVRSLKLENFEPVHERVEHLPELEGFAGSHGAIVSRAFTALPRFAALASPLLAEGGRLLAMKGSAGEQELAEGAEELARLGFSCTALHRLRLPMSGSGRTILELRKTSL